MGSHANPPTARVLQNDHSRIGHWRPMRQTRGEAKAIVDGVEDMDGPETFAWRYRNTLALLPDELHQYYHSGYGGSFRLVDNCIAAEYSIFRSTDQAPSAASIHIIRLCEQLALNADGTIVALKTLTAQNELVFKFLCLTTVKMKNQGLELSDEKPLLSDRPVQCQFRAIGIAIRWTVKLLGTQLAVWHHDHLPLTAIENGATEAFITGWYTKCLSAASDENDPASPPGFYVLWPAAYGKVDVVTAGGEQGLSSVDEPASTSVPAVQAQEDSTGTLPNATDVSGEDLDGGVARLTL